MQYLLTQEEMDGIASERRAIAMLPGGSIDHHMVALIKVVQRIASEFVEEGSTERAHGCVHVRHPDGPGYQTRYCDHCPVAGICPQPKQWSK